MEGTINTRGNINKYVGEYSDLLVHERKSKLWNNFKVLAIFFEKIYNTTCLGSIHSY